MSSGKDEMGGGATRTEPTTSGQEEVMLTYKSIRFHFNRFASALTPRFEPKPFPSESWFSSKFDERGLPGPTNFLSRSDSTSKTFDRFEFS